MTAVPDPVDESVLADLRRRLAETRRVRLPRGTAWERGVDEDYLADLVAYWANSYDWRPHEQRIRSLPWSEAEVGGVRYRAVHQRTDGAAATVVLLHGWPDSVLRFEKVLPLLTDLNVVVPALPGYPFAPPLTEPGMSSDAMAEVVEKIVSRLGYERYVVSGGDVGSGVAERLALRAPDRVAALHLTDVPYAHLATVDASDLAASDFHASDFNEDERAYLAAGQQWASAEGAYAHEQSTKPHTLAVGLGDSPAGLLAWIVEKLREWSDCGGDVESVFPRDDLLTWVTAYWVTGAIGTSFGSYVEPRKTTGYVATPTAVMQFPHDLVSAPRAFAERFFDLRIWEEADRGGHFAAWEHPQRFVKGLRSAVALSN